MKEKKEKAKLSATAAIMWRISALVLGLWAFAMSYLTVLLAQDMYDHYDSHIARYTARESFGQTGDPVALEREQMLLHAAAFDSFAAHELEMPLYQNPYEDEPTMKRILKGDLLYDVAMVFYDGQTHSVIDPQDYCTVTYMDEAEWFGGCEVAERHTYIDLTEGDLIPGSGSGTAVYLNHFDGNRLTGYFEGDRFVVTDIDYLNIQYPGLLPKDLTLGQADSQGHLKWHEAYEGSVETDRELVRIYTDEILSYGRLEQSVTSNGQTFGSMGELASQYLRKAEPLGQESLWHAVILRTGHYTDVDGQVSRYVAAISCWPLYSTVLRLQWFYVLTLLPLVVILLLLRRRLRRELGGPLAQMVLHGRKGFAPLPETVGSRWQEPCELEQWYVQTQQRTHEMLQENRRLRAAMDYAKNAEESRKKMVSGMAHELKTPLAIIHSYCEGLEEGIAAEKRVEYLQVIREETERMDGMVLELLDLSRLEAGKVRLQSDRFSLPALTRSVFGDMELLMEKKGLTLHESLVEDFQITADEGRIGQVVRNLASNAVKYTPEGGKIWLSIYRHKDQTVLTMENECEPLPEEALAQVWDSFYRVSDSRTEKGTGLGLTVVKTIIELHGGSCHVMNTQNGVQFGFRLP
ncbi:MAG: HAMP domain-containing histidine kinase [Oscillospiraceae bacterium]|nr:HAMP domain-containing histidine kinase [Oscillospiraceae bacterium]